MNKKLSAIVIATLLPAVLFTACKQQNITDSSSETVNNKTTTEKSITEDASAQSATEQIIITTTCPPTDPVSDPTRASTTATPDVFINFLYKPEKIIFYHNGKPQTLTEEMCDDVIKRINKVTKNDRWGLLKLAVNEEYIEKIKNENLCIEIYYDGVQLLNDLQNIEKMTFNFEKALIVLDGDDKNTIFFCKDGKYMNGPVRPYNSVLSEEILKDIFDE